VYIPLLVDPNKKGQKTNLICTIKKSQLPAEIYDAITYGCVFYAEVPVGMKTNADLVIRNAEMPVMQ
jgi:hypothetical protein